MTKRHDDLLFLFPPNARAQRASQAEQSLKVLEEAQEIVAAYNDGEPSERVIEEALDCIQACEGLLRKYRRLDVRRGIVRVNIKNYKRGDYRAE